jgi:hypothetical protein
MYKLLQIPNIYYSEDDTVNKDPFYFLYIKWTTSIVAHYLFSV